MNSTYPYQYPPSGADGATTNSADPTEQQVRRYERDFVISASQVVGLPPAVVDSAYPQGGRTVLTMAQYLLNNAIFNVLDFGADRTGTLDSTAAIQAAVDAAHAVNGRIKFPSGVYKTSASILFDSYQTFDFECRTAATITTSATVAFKARTRGTAITRSVTFIAPSIEYTGTARTAGTIALDLTDCSYCVVDRPTIRSFDVGISGKQLGVGAGYYNAVIDCEIASNNVGVDMGLAANAWTIKGGRFFSNIVAGIRMESNNGNNIQSSFEHNGRGVWMKSGVVQNFVAGCYFEANDEASVWFDVGATANKLSGNHYSNGTDQPVDRDGSNVDLSPSSFGLGAPGSGIGGRNVLTNGGFDTDSNSDGVADGWEMPPTIPAGTTLALDSSVRKGGRGYSQRITIASGGTSQRVLTQQNVAVEAGARYVFSGWVRMDTAGTWGFAIGDTTTDFNYMNWPVDTTSQWVFLRQPFKATADTVTLYVYERDYGPGVTRNVWMDEFQLQQGSIPTAFTG